MISVWPCRSIISNPLLMNALRVASSSSDVVNIQLSHSSVHLEEALECFWRRLGPVDSSSEADISPVHVPDYSRVFLTTSL